MMDMKGQIINNQIVWVRQSFSRADRNSLKKYGYSTGRHYFGILIVTVLLYIYSASVLAQSTVTVKEVAENIPTYLAGPPDLDPMFFFGQGSQGAEGRIYPYPLYDNLTNKKRDKIYNVVYLENEYVKIGILPDVGGRIISAQDKTNNYNFIYTQHVIKPALIGLIGAWISGGVEWNIPHHHRASTFIPVQWKKEENSDGSKTVWVGELEVRQRMRWAVGYTLKPRNSVLECSVRISNRTPEVHSMLCFANVAVHTNKDYQVIFPPSTQLVTGHGKRSFTPWPVPDSLDLSWWKNHKRGGSYFAWNYEDDFVAGYDHGKNAGFMSIADHNIVPGKKFFTWGVDSPWDKILTDNDGPYLEIMVGAYSDNQPDYSWLQPFEERAFILNFYPFQGIQGVKNANIDAAVNLEIENGIASIGFYTTKVYNNAVVRLLAGNQIITEEKISINPGKPYASKVKVPANLSKYDVKAALLYNGHELISYSPVKLQPMPMPKPYVTPPAPSKITNDEELFLAGQRIDQFHNPTLDADPYWKELIGRDSGNIAANTGLGILDLRCGRFVSAEKHFRKAVDRLTAQWTTPKNGEPLYYLGVALKAQGKADEAFTTFYKAAWNQEWKAPAYYSMSEIATAKRNFTSALDYSNRSLDANAYNVRAYSLKASILRHLDHQKEAMDVITFALQKTDPLDVRLMAEKWLITRDPATANILFSTMNSFQATAQETAAEYYNSGLWGDGIEILQQVIARSQNKISVSPIVYYYLGYFYEKTGDVAKAAEYRQQATLQSPDYVFPFQSEVVEVLKRAIEANPQDARAPYYLGNLLFDWQPEEAIALWEKSAKLNPKYPITWRNLAIAYSHKTDDESWKKAIMSMENAVNVEKPYPTHLAEMDRLYKSDGIPVDKRLALLQKHFDAASKNDEALASAVNLKTYTGQVDESIKLMQGRTFNLWEGANVFNSGQSWADAHLVRGLNKYRAKKYKEALADFQAALTPPENLRAVLRYNAHNYQLLYWIGCAYEAMGETDKAKQSWNEVINPDFMRKYGGGSNVFGTDLNLAGEQRYFTSLARKKLDIKADVEKTFRELAATINDPGAIQTTDPADPQFVAPRRLPSRDVLAIPHYYTGLGYAGLGNKGKARQEFNAALAASPDFLSAKIALDQL